VYNKESEGALLWNDKDLNINWEVNEPLVSEKDITAGNFKNFVSKF
jgi:dTDP-4-dehydrorhamnose 3,5-epimerase